jgi:hypothetical protein
MAAKTSEKPEREAKICAYAEALAYFIEEPKAISDPTLKLFVDFFKERIAQEEERLSKGLGKQMQLVKV